MRKKNLAHKAFLILCKKAGLPEPKAEFRYHPTRRWRFDYAFPDHKLALEIEGGVWIQGRHNRASGFLKDMEKYNQAAVLGWRILRCTPKEWLSKHTIELISQAIGGQGEEN